MGLALPRLAGCLWESSMNLGFPGGLDGSGNGVQSLGIPNDFTLENAAIYLQALLLTATNEQTTNPFAVSLGR
jgi:hypothetical protein